jgi:hypothetical protein
MKAESDSRSNYCSSAVAWAGMGIEGPNQAMLQVTVGRHEK